VVEGSGGVPVINTDYLAGRAGSIRAGALAVPDGATAIVVVSVDQPRERGITQRLLALQKDRDALIAVPSFRGQRGHPAILDGSLLDELRNVNEAGEGLRTLMRRHAAERVEVAFDTATVVLDLNRPDEYEAARSKYLGR
ncbi:MAG: nucleotidyltransferase family protein, partial [Dehalococcoidia bacterium]